MNDIAALRSGANYLQHEVTDLQEDHIKTANNYSRLAQLLDGIAASKQEHRTNLEAQYPTAFQPDARNGEAVAKGADEILQQQRLVHECLSLVGALSEEEQVHGEQLNRRQRAPASTPWRWSGMVIRLRSRMRPGCAAICRRCATTFPPWPTVIR